MAWCDSATELSDSLDFFENLVILETPDPFEVLESVDPIETLREALNTRALPRVRARK